MFPSTSLQVFDAMFIGAPGASVTSIARDAVVASRPPRRRQRCARRIGDVHRNLTDCGFDTFLRGAEQCPKAFARRDPFGRRSTTTSWLPALNGPGQTAVSSLCLLYTSPSP